jgi:hypothetical protein
LTSARFTIVVVLTAGARTAASQTVSVAAARWFTAPQVVDYRLSLLKRELGPVTFLPFGQLAVQGPRADGASFAGAGLDLAIRLTHLARPYLVGGISGGFLDLRGSGGLGLWHSWSAGIGFEAIRVGPVGVALEARYQLLSRGPTDGVSVGLRIGTALGSRRQRSDPAPSIRSDPGPAERSESSPALATAAGPKESGELIGIVREAMGTPYRWGGTDRDGFDCSGLIQYAYRAIGVALPRRSADQARVGRAVPTEIDRLVAGDILTFSEVPGGEVSHVGLYLGGGRFIHSASDGVRESDLRADDPRGRWWYLRWVGARRVLEDPA